MATSLNSFPGSTGSTGGIGGSSGGSSVDPFSMVGYAGQQTNISSQIGDMMMGQLAQASMDQLKQTMLTGQLKTITSLGEGIAKTFKAMGDAVKGLC